MADYLGEFEQIVLLAILRFGEEPAEYRSGMRSKSARRHVAAVALWLSKKSPGARQNAL
jgi:hypothetical protein